MKQSKTSEHVLWFAEQMERKLDENRHKGDREGWLKADIMFLFSRLIEEVSELAEAMRWCDGREVTKEAADVANMAMMVADRYVEMNIKERRTRFHNG